MSTPVEKSLEDLVQELEDAMTEDTARYWAVRYLSDPSFLNRGLHPLPADPRESARSSAILEAQRLGVPERLHDVFVDELLQRGYERLWDEFDPLHKLH